jgi:hypothetical protein
VLVLVWLEVFRAVRVFVRFQFLIGMRVLMPLVAGVVVRMFVHMAMSVFVAVGMAMRLNSMSMFMGMHMPMRMRMRMLVHVLAVHHLLLAFA